MVSIHRPLGYGPSMLPLRHSALPSCSLAVGSRALHLRISSTATGGEYEIGYELIDLWVMGPACFRCATLLFLPAVLLLAPGLCIQKYILENNESQAFRSAEH